MLTRLSSRTGASVAALATALAAGPAAAQLSFQAPNPEVISGSVNIVRGSGGVETYTVTSPTAVLDFEPFDQGAGGPPIEFQAGGTSVTYQGAAPFTILNRIVPVDPARAIRFDGSVTSTVGGATGGAVWFYSPGGIVIGGGARFDVGSLLLATGDPTGGTGEIGATNSFAIASNASGNAGVTVQPGAEIKALAEGSYVALVAPTVIQDGKVQVNGAAAYVAAEQATLSINQGLFDIDVVVGSDGGGFPIRHNGTTGGPSSTGSAGDNHGIYMVAVPKNTAITMLIAPTGDLGFDQAASASIENGAIYLQAGGDVSVTAGKPVETRVNELPVSALDAKISVTGGNAAGVKVTSRLIAQASGNSLVTSTATGRLISLDQDAFIYSGKSAGLSNRSGQPFTAAGRVIVNTVGTVPGQAAVSAQAGSPMTFQNKVEVYASAFPGRVYAAPLDLTKGGNAFLQADGAGATISAAQGLIFAEGFDGTQTKNTFGGNAQILATNGGQVALTSSAGSEISATANAFNPGQTAKGGSALLIVDNGAISIAGAINVSAFGQGGSGATGIGGSATLFAGAGGGSLTAGNANIGASGTTFGASAGAGGGAAGGTASVDLSTTSKTTTVNVNSLTIKANAAGGAGAFGGSFAGGSATGGAARLVVFKGTSLTSAGGVTLQADATGGDGGPGAAGGAATAGTASVQVAGALTFADATLEVRASGGTGGTGPTQTIPGGAGGAALPSANGISVRTLNGGAITGKSAILDTTASGGAGGSGKDGTGLVGSGGDALASNIFFDVAASGGEVKLSGNLRLNVLASGGSTGFGQGGAAKGGAATAGQLTLSANGGLVEVGSLSVEGEAFGGTAVATEADGGDAAAGKALVTALPGGTLRVTTGDAVASMVAFGGRNTGGGDKTGGEGVGGTVDWNANGGRIELLGNLQINADGFGGDYSGASGGTGGTGTGGNARAVAGSNAGIFTVNGFAEASASGEGGSILTSPDGFGGAGTGGEARFGTNIGSKGASFIVGGDVFADASGQGGQGGFQGGVGQGGAPADTTNGPFNKGAYIAGTGGSVTIGGVANLEASGTGGSGTRGASGTGGYAEIYFAGATFDVGGGIVSVDASGFGGTALGELTGGPGSGGKAFVTAASGGKFGVPLDATSRITIDQLLLDASGTGGQGGQGAAGQAGGEGGVGTGGQANAVAQAGGGLLQVKQVTLFVVGDGGVGGSGGEEDEAGIGGAGGRGGDGIAGFINFGTVSGPDTPANLGSAELGDAVVFVSGLGGDGGAGVIGSKGGGAGGRGGDGFGGSGALLSRGAPVTADIVSALAQGIGGSGGTGATSGAEGAGTGGSFGLLATNRSNRPERGAITAVQFSVAAIGQGGADGEDFGPSTAGQAFSQVSKADVTVDSILLASQGDAPPPVGRESYVKVDNGVLAAPSTLNVAARGDLQLSVVDDGVIRTDSLSLSATGSLLPAGAGAPGLIEVGSDFFALFGKDFVTAADFTTAGRFTVDAGGALQVGDVTADGGIDLAADGPLTAGALTAGAGVRVEGAQSVTVGDIAAGDFVELSALGALTAGDIRAAQRGGGDIGGYVDVSAEGGARVGDVEAASFDFDNEGAGGNAAFGDIKAETVAIEHSGDGTVTVGRVTTGDFFFDLDFGTFGIGIAAGGDLKVAGIDAFTSAGLASETGGVQVGDVTAADNLLILAKTDVAAGAIAAGEDPGDTVLISNVSAAETDPILSQFDPDEGDLETLRLDAVVPVRLDGSLTIAGPITVANFAAATAGAFRSGAITAPERLFVDAGGAIGSGALETAGALTLISSDALTLGDLKAASVDLKSTLAVTTGAIDATGFVKVDAGTVAAVEGQVSGTTISVVSGDLALGANGRLGTAGTTALALTARGEATFGGTAADGYVISAIEAQGLRAQSITVSAPFIRVRDAALSGSAGDGSANLVGDAGQLTLSSGGGIRVDGALRVDGAAAGNRVTLSAAGAVEVATNAGGVSLFGSGAGGLGGTLRISGSAIRVATAALLPQLPNFSVEQRNQALAAVAGSPRPQGFLEANRIEFETGQLLIQNSNTADLFGGFSAGAGGASLRGGRSGPVDVTIFGRIADASGGFKTNADAGRLLTLDPGDFGPTSVTAASTFNACAFSGSCGAAEPPPPPPPPPEEEEEVEVVIDRIPAVIAAAVNSSLASTADPEAVAALPTVTLVTTIDTAPLRTEPVISDPVTGGGNPSLWDAPEDAEPGEGDEQ